MKSENEIDKYISNFPSDIEKTLQEIRKTISATAPDADETISYMMPTFKYRGKNLIHFAGYAAHIGIYPTGANLETELPEVAKYRTGKGTLQFPLSEKFPFDLLRKIVQLRVKQVDSK